MTRDLATGQVNGSPAPVGAGTAVLGCGISGYSAARFLATRGELTLLADTREAPPNLAEFRAEFPDVPVCAGELGPSTFEGVGTLVVSPGLDTRAPLIAGLRERGVEIVGDIELFARVVNAPVIAVTGSNGKSTVVSLLDALFRAAGHEVATGGNLGTPALDLLTTPAPDFYLLELSSFQLELTASLKPLVAACLNIAPDHMDRYATFADYAAAKRRIYAGATRVVGSAGELAEANTLGAIPAGAACIEWNCDASTDAGFSVRAGMLCVDGVPQLNVDTLPLVGAHNLANIVAALEIGRAAGLESAPMLAGLANFRGLPHRCELVLEHDGVRFVNDSKGTNVAASAAAIEGLGHRGPLVLIAGGVGKAADFAPLADAARGRLRAAVLIGEDAPGIARVLEGVCPVRFADDMPRAVEMAAREAMPGDTVLLSPACASFDMFRNFEARGVAFAAAVRALTAQGAAV